MYDYILLDWGSLTLFLLIVMRMSGFTALNPVFARDGIPATVQGGFVLFLSVTVFAFEGGSVAMPDTTIELVMKFLMEFFLGFLLSLIMNIFFMVTSVAGSAIDTQMGFSMAQTYDPSSGTTATATASLLGMLMFLVFFAANGHHTLLRILLTSGELVPYGQVRISDNAYLLIIDLFVSCMLLGLKLTMPILAAELLGQMGMGILMKAIPQINVFVINIDLKVLIGLVLMYVFMPDMTVFILDFEREMLFEIQQLLSLAKGS